MMSAFRAFTKSPAAIALFGLLILSFAVWGVHDMFHAKISDWVVSAGSRQVSADQFKRIFQNQLQSLQQQNGGQAITAQDAAAHGVDRQILQQLAQQETLLEAVRRSGVVPSPQLVIDQLRKIPAFFNPITGAFDEKQYQSRLAQAELTPAMYEASLKDDLAGLHFSAGMTSGLRPPLTYTAVFATVDQQSRSADYFVIDPRSVEQPAKPTDADLQKLITDHADQLRRPETRTISLVRFSAAALALTLKADPAEVQKQFDFRKANLSVAERRSFVEIQAKDQAQAAAIAGRLGKGEDPAAIAKSYGVKPLTYAAVPKTAVTDPRIGEAAFKLQPGQVSGPVQGEFGFAVVKLQAITPAKPASLEDVRPQIEQEVNQRAAEEKVYDQVQKYEDAHGGGSPMAQAAKAAGVEMFSLGPMTADGHTLQGQPVQGLNQKMVTDAFALVQGGETDVVDLGKGEYYAIRADKVTPPALPSLDEIRPQLTQVYMQQQLMQKVSAKADGLVQRIKKGESLDAVAASAGAKVQHTPVLTRAKVQQDQQLQGLGRDFLGRLFQAKAGDAFAATGVNYSMAVVKVTQVQPGSVQDVANEAVALQPQLAQQMAQGDVAEMVFTAASAKVKPKVDEQRAKQAIGVQPDQTPASGAPAKPANKASSKAQ
jgi:peptidyl-prolyl cis-trans isomerase D